MKKLLRISKYVFLSLVGIIFVAVIGLNIFHAQQYRASIEREAELKSNFTSTKDTEFQKRSFDDTVNILPPPQFITRSPGALIFPNNISFSVEESMVADVSRYLSILFGKEPSLAEKGFITIEYIGTLSSQEYHLRITSQNVIISYSKPQGLYYALVSLKQLHEINNGKLPYVEIRDFPSMDRRGVLLDISRDKIPTLTTLKQVIDDLSALKYNHLQLYIEGASFAYPSFSELWQGKETPITPEEFRELDRYSKERFIDLVPNQNALGHMAVWLESDQFSGLAECPDGYKVSPVINMKTTLDPYDSGSINLIEQMTADLLPNFTSDYYNMNLDEPFELGRCKNAEITKDVGVEQVYLDYVKQMHTLSSQYNKKMLMWADIVSNHPELLPEIPKDITLLEWGYEAEHPFATNTAKIQNAGLSYLVSPGTSSWMSLTGRTDNMFKNIDNAVDNGLAHSANGMLLTDWGDLGHWQYLPISYAPFAYGAAKSWNSNGIHEQRLVRFLDKFLFRDANNKIGQLLLDLGRYNQFEELLPPNMTVSFIAYQFGLVDRVLHEAIFEMMNDTMSQLLGDKSAELMRLRFENHYTFQFEALMDYLDTLEQQLNDSQLKIQQAALVKSEMGNGIEMVRLGASIVQFNRYSNEWSAEERIRFLENMNERCSHVILEHRRLWLERNKPGGLERSLTALNKLQQQVTGKMELEKKGGFFLKWDQLKNRVISAVAVLYL